VNRRFSSNVQSQLSYTVVALSRHDIGQLVVRRRSAATNPYDEEYDYGLCQIDRTHNLRASAIYQLPSRPMPLSRLASVDHCQRRQWRDVHTAGRVDQAGLQPAARSVRTWRLAARSMMPSQADVSTPRAAASPGTSIPRSSHCRRRARWGPVSAAMRSAARLAHSGLRGQQETSAWPATPTSSYAPRSSISSTA
jgi:hypothetical protein